jgi:siroheme synthase-like protein
VSALASPLFPVGLVLEGRRCLVVGGGSVAGRKLASLLRCRAAVTLVAPEAHEAMRVIAEDGTFASFDGPPLEVELRPYRRGEAAGYRFVVAATGVAEVDGAVLEDAEAAGVFANAVDDLSGSTAIIPSVGRVGPVTVAVSTGGVSPALARWLRDRAVEALGPATAELARLVGEARDELKRHGLVTAAVPWDELLAGPLPGLVEAGRTDEARALLAEAVARARGAGPT